MPPCWAHFHTQILDRFSKMDKSLCSDLVFPSFLKICCAPLVEGPLGTNTSSACIMVSLAILQVYVLAVVSLEIAKPRILDAVVAVISSSSIHYISCTSVQIF